MNSSTSFIKDFFPTYSNELSDNVRDNVAHTYKEADQFMLKLLVIHWVLGSTIMAYFYSTYLLGFLGGAVITGIAYAVYRNKPGSLLSRITMGASFMAFSAVYIQQHLGLIEMHFHIFIAISFLIRYKDIAPVLSATATTAAHHILFNIAQQYGLAVAGTPIILFNYGNGWLMVALHVVFVLAETAVICNSILNLTREYLNNVEVFTIMDDLSNSVYQTSEASNHISSAGQELANNAENNKEVVTHSSESINDMSQSIKKLDSQTSKAKSKVQNVVKDTGKMNKAMLNLKESSNKISTINQTIDDIAAQTNMLAINAAVEAARAGEAGSGFAVVTKEIRTLAQKTAQAATNIRDMLGDNIEKAETGVKASEEIADKIEELESWIRNVNNISEEQITQLEELRGDISKISNTTDHTANMAEKNAATSQELDGQIEVLKNAVDKVNEKAKLSK